MTLRSTFLISSFQSCYPPSFFLLYLSSVPLCVRLKGRPDFGAPPFSFLRCFIFFQNKWWFEGRERWRDVAQRCSLTGMESQCSRDGDAGGAGDCLLFFFWGVVFFNVHDKVSVTGVHGWRGSCAGLRFPLNGPFRWARHLTRPATTSPAILHYGRWLWLFPFIPASVRRHVSAEWPGHVIKGDDETALDPLFTRAQGHSIRYSVLKSCSSVLTNSQVAAFSLSPGCPPFYLWLLNVWGKKYQKKKDREYRKWQWLLWMLQYGQFYQK